MTKEEKIIEAIGYLEYIDGQFLVHKRERLSRYSEEWGTWSRKMNIELRQKEKENQLLVEVFSYWVLISRILELFYRFRLTKIALKSKYKKEAMDLKMLIKSGDLLDKEKSLSIEEVLKKGIINGFN